jgi:hypothetical protein
LKTTCDLIGAELDFDRKEPFSEKEKHPGSTSFEQISLMMDENVDIAWANSPSL